MKESMIRIITVLFRKSQSYLSVLLSKYNLTAAEQPFFAVLQKCDGVTQDELSALISVDKSATARTVKSLEEKGYVTRVQDEQDKRQNRVFLTEAARECWPDVQRELIRFNEFLTQNIDANNLEIVYTALKQMEKNAIYVSVNKDITAEQEGMVNGQ
ncbi:MAG: MarR family winged helix-turn-helix transcriptional regulator [Lachnospiraceae bacterium]